jgi:dTDP-4-amino-4,6-dideoxygalactose transaminase
MAHHKLPITKPFFDKNDLKSVIEPLKSGWVVQGPKVREFEELFAEFSGTKYAVAVSNCSAALHLGLLAAGIGPGDEVIVPSFTYIATANAVEYCGAKVTFCDIDLRTFNINPQYLKKIINKKTKAVIPVSLFGLPAELEKIDSICKKHGIILFEDAACAVGASIKGKHSGNWGIGGAFSFHPRKAVTTGEGGILATNNRKISAKVRSLRDHGAAKSDFQRNSENGGSLLPRFDSLGYNYRMTDIQGALGISQMSKIESIIQGRRRGAAIYNKLLKDVEFLITPFIPKNFNHAYQSFVILITDKENSMPDFKKVEILNNKRNKLMASLEKSGISVRQGTHAVHTLGYYKKKYRLKNEDYRNSYMADRLSITLPLFYDISKEECLYVKDGILEHFDRL